MSVKQDPHKNTWTVSYGKRHPITKLPVSLRRIGIKSRAEAVRVERELIVEVEKRLHRAVCPLWEQVVEEYIAEAVSRGLQAITYRTWQGWLRTNTESLNGSTVDVIDGARIRKIIDVRMKSASITHKKDVLKAIRRVFKFAVEKRYLASNPTPDLMFRVGDKLKGVLTEEQARQLLDEAKALRSPWYPHWALALYTGMRNGELFALTWPKVDFSTRLIRIDAAWNNKDGFKSTKSGEDRMVEIAPVLMPVLKDLKASAESGDFVLPRVRGWAKGQQANELRRFLEGLGLPRVRFHDLRASWATMLLSKGIPPVKVMTMGGWVNIKTMNIYIRKAGVDVQGCSDVLQIHQHDVRIADVVPIRSAERC